MQCLKESDLQFHDAFSGVNGDVSFSMKRSFASSLMRQSLRFAHEMFERQAGRSMDVHVMEILVESLTELVGISFPSLFRERDHDHVGIDLLSVVIKVEMTLWGSRQKWFESDKHDLTAFLAQISSRDVSFEKLVMTDSTVGRVFHGVWSKATEVNFKRLFMACANAQARLLDFMQDSVFLIHLLRACCLNVDKEFLFPYIRGVAENVIDRKSVDHAAATNELTQALNKAEYFSDFEEVLGSVVEAWGVAHG